MALFDGKLEVVPIEGTPYMVAPNLPCLVAAERHFKKSGPELFSPPSIEVLAWIAYEQTRRDGITVPVSFDKWLETIGDVTVESNEADIPLDETP